MIFCTSLGYRIRNSLCSDSLSHVQDLPVIGSDIRFMSLKIQIADCRLLRHSDIVNIPSAKTYSIPLQRRRMNWKFWYYSFFSLRNSMHRLSCNKVSRTILLIMQFHHSGGTKHQRKRTKHPVIFPQNPTHKSACIKFKCGCRKGWE